MGWKGKDAMRIVKAIEEFCHSHNFVVVSLLTVRYRQWKWECQITTSAAHKIILSKHARLDFQ